MTSVKLMLTGMMLLLIGKYVGKSMPFFVLGVVVFLVGIGIDLFKRDWTKKF